MAKEHKEGWTYIYSDELEQELAFKPGTPVMTEDKTVYSLKEISILNDAGCRIKKIVHLVKKNFRGEIIHASKK